MAGDEGGAEGDDVVVGNDDMMSDGDVQSESGDDGSAAGAAAIEVSHDMVTSATDVDGGGVRGGTKRSRGTDNEAEGHEEEDSEEERCCEAGQSVHGTAGGDMTRDSADHASAQKRGTSTSGKAKGKKSGQQKRKRDKYGGSGA